MTIGDQADGWALNHVKYPRLKTDRSSPPSEYSQKIAEWLRLQERRELLRKAETNVVVSIRNYRAGGDRTSSISEGQQDVAQ